MRIEIHAERFGMNRRLYRYIRRRVLACIGEVQDRVRRIMVSLSDVVLGPGCVEKRCLVVMELEGLPGVVCHEVDRDAFGAVDRTMAHIGWLLQRKLQGDRAAASLWAARSSAKPGLNGRLNRRLEP